MGGTYTLVIALAEPATIGVGALGECEFPAGEYAYTGSAFGPGGFSRIDRHRKLCSEVVTRDTRDRHRELARGEREVRHWHVDYLLGHPAATIEEVVRTPERDVECAVARALPDAGIGGFGASDCGCGSHLASAERGLLGRVERAHRAATGDVT
ncbi:GIY-YIG nuclease family protein [Halalkalicoccus tibetensis]|uniref:DUF123 domain-containing protein n=1 Tax=Halalkalicoccus tibetensis TaxID=175632 RepID=A0ABD5V7N0_9EURY